MLRSRQGHQAQTLVRRNQGREWGNSPKILPPPVAALLQEGVTGLSFIRGQVHTPRAPLQSQASSQPSSRWGTGHFW